MQEKITSFAKTLGFDLIEFTSAKVSGKPVAFYRKWLKEKKNANMQYLEKISPRKNLKEILPNAKTVIVLGMNYFYKQNPLKKGYGRIARYAYGRDYHKIIGKKLKELEKFIHELSPNAETKSYVDTGPVLERSLAEQAGLGVIGKNSCLITKEFGSWVFLGEIITNLKLKTKAKYPKRFSICGTCTRCIDACPTHAIAASGAIDSHRCISYLTIENKGKIPKEFHSAIKKTGRIFGCDICQEVCPHNCRATICHPELACTRRGVSGSTKIAGDQISLKKILEIKSDEEFLKLFAGSPLMRAKRKGLRRNVLEMKK